MDKGHSTHDDYRCIKTKGAVNAFRALGAAAGYHLANAKESEDGRFFNCMSTILCCAFCLEGFLNSMGELFVPTWSADKVERKTPRAKLEIVCEAMKFDLDLRKRPFALFPEIFKYRGLLVHPKAQQVRSTIETIGHPSERLVRMKRPETYWEQKTKVDWADKAWNDTNAMIRDLHRAGNVSGEPFVTRYTSPTFRKPDELVAERLRKKRRESQ